LIFNSEAIPLVDAEFEFLPLHFSVDPGVHHDWIRDDEEGTGHMEGGLPSNGSVVEDVSISRLLVTSDTDKLDMLLAYMDVEQIPIPAFKKASVSPEAAEASAKDDPMKLDTEDQLQSKEVWVSFVHTYSH